MKGHEPLKLEMQDARRKIGSKMHGKKLTIYIYVNDLL